MVLVPLFAVLALGLVLLLAGASGAFLFLRACLNDDTAPLAPDLTLPGEHRRVMAIWAHPDDEIAAAGALSQGARPTGSELVLVYLTAGEAARNTTLTPSALAEARRAEAKAAGALLGALETEVLEFPDGGLSSLDGATVKARLNALIDLYRPAVLVTFDDQVGYYGHADHVQTGRWVREIFQERRGDPGFSARRLYQATLPGPLIAAAKRFVAAFRNHYPSDPSKGLPAPTLAVRIVASATIKRRLLDVHRTQAAVIADVQPYYDRLPAALYYRLFDREYFHLADER